MADSTNLCVTNQLSETFNCSLERAFKTPILGDATKILPFVTGFTKDDTWGVLGGSRIPIVIMAGKLGIDQIFARDENKYWKWSVTQYGAWLFFAIESIGEWWCTDNLDGTISVTWKYTWVSRNIFTHPLTWIYVKLFWRVVMKNGMKSIKQMAEAETPYIYDI